MRLWCLTGLIGVLWLVAAPTAPHAEEPAKEAAAATAPSPWDEKGIEDFSLTERSGRTVTKADLLGKPWVACFVFTRCAGPCPVVTAQMKILQEKLKDTDVRLVTITVDPETDTPEVLRSYAKNYGADPERWLFLTGDQKAIYHLIHHSFKMPVQEQVGKDRVPGFEIIHSTNMMHVDAKGRVLGKYHAENEDDMTRLRRILLGQPVAPPAWSSNKPPVPAASDASAAPVSTSPAWVSKLPAINASLNALATCLLILGYVMIKLRYVRVHASIMLTSFGVSIVFLGTYLLYHYFAGSKRFEGVGLVRPVYFAILISHVVLAAVVPVLAVMTIYRALKAQWQQHLRIARITFPIWLYVSVTGVIIYGMLYHWPQGG